MFLHQGDELLFVQLVDLPVDNLIILNQKDGGKSAHRVSADGGRAFIRIDQADEHRASLSLGQPIHPGGDMFARWAPVGPEVEDDWKGRAGDPLC